MELIQIPAPLRSEVFVQNTAYRQVPYMYYCKVLLHYACNLSQQMLIMGGPVSRNLSKFNFILHVQEKSTSPPRDRCCRDKMCKHGQALSSQCDSHEAKSFVVKAWESRVDLRRLCVLCQFEGWNMTVSLSLSGARRGYSMASAVRTRHIHVHVRRSTCQLSAACIQYSIQGQVHCDCTTYTSVRLTSMHQQLASP